MDQVCEVVGSWKLTEIKLAKNESRHQETREGSRENREKSQRALLLADGEKCCKLTDLCLKLSASASTSANTASTNVSNKGEPAHLERDRTERRMKRETWITA